MQLQKVVPDTSILISAFLSQTLHLGALQFQELIISEASLAELEHQANSGKSAGFLGLDELKTLKTLSSTKNFIMRYSGRRPTSHETRDAPLGEIDALIRQIAYDEDATLITADKIQSRVAEAHGIKTYYLPPQEYSLKPLQLDAYFDPTTMSVHLREHVQPMAKKGTPGHWNFVPLAAEPLRIETLKDISREIIEEAGNRVDGFLEIQREGSTIVQLGHYRIVILRPPFSDNWEITAVKPTCKLTLSDYTISDKLRDRLLSQAEGILIAGAPGMGKSTFGQALVEHYASLGKIVKTVEAPRDLVLSDTITQLSYFRSTPEEVHDVLLLSRPDYSLFDEMRNIPDFLLFTDLRLSGVGMVGVVHGTNPMDAIQRFIGKIDLGVIPHVVDTVIFIQHGKIAQVLRIALVVKVPSGMTEADLARPTVVITDFETNKPLAEIYSYGEETVVVPVSETQKSALHTLAAQHIERALHKFSEQVRVELTTDNSATVFVPEKYIASIIGKEGKTVKELETQLGIGLDIRALGEQKPQKIGVDLPYTISGAGKHAEFLLGESLAGKDVDIYLASDYLATVAVSKKGVVKIKKTNKLGKTVLDAIDHGEPVRFIGGA